MQAKFPTLLYSSPQGYVPGWTVRSCDGIQRCSETGPRPYGDVHMVYGQTKTFVIDNFDPTTNMIEASAGLDHNSNPDGIMTKLRVEVCDANGENCKVQSVEESSNGKVNKPIWIDVNCGMPFNSPTEHGCEPDCTCYNKFYLKQNGDKWSLSPTDTCDDCKCFDEFPFYSPIMDKGRL